MKNVTKNSEEIEKQGLVKHALDRVLNLYPIDRVFVYPIIDILKLIIQRPVIVSFFKQSGKHHLIYTSVKDNDSFYYFYAVFLPHRSLNPLKYKIKFSKEISLAVHEFIQFPSTATIRNLEKTEFEKLKLTMNTLFETNGKRKDAIVQAVTEYEKKFGHDESRNELLEELQEYKKANRNESDVINKDINLFCKDMRRIVDLSMEGIDKSSLIRTGADSHSLPFSNLFFVIRFPLYRKYFNYSAQILLSTKQKKEIQKWWGKESHQYDYKNFSQIFISGYKENKMAYPDVKDLIYDFISDSRKSSQIDYDGFSRDFISRYKQEKKINMHIGKLIEKFVSEVKDNPPKLLSIIETPLGFEATSIADSIFESGVIDFSRFSARQGLDWNAHGRADVRRQLAEHIVYSEITKFQHPFYIPIHVGGSPWIVLFTMPPQRYDKQNYMDWKHNLDLYMDLIPVIADRVRAGVRKLYLIKLSEIIAVKTGEFLDGNTPTKQVLCDEINKTLVSLMSFFPYDGLLFSSYNAGKMEPMDLPNGGRIWFKLIPNPSFKKQINFYLIDDTDEIKDAAKEGMQQASIKHKHLYVSLMRHQHTIFNLTPANVGLMNDAIESWDDSQKAKKYIEEARRASEVLSVVLSIIFEGEIEKFKSVVELIEFLHNHNSLLGPEPGIVIDPRVEESGIPLDQKDRGNAFLVLWNLWSNASKKYPGTKTRAFSVRLSCDESGVSIEFKNEGVMPKSWAEFLSGNVKSPEHGSKNRITLQGLEVVVSALHDLGWAITEARSDEGKTIIVVLIPNTKWK